MDEIKSEDFEASFVGDPPRVAEPEVLHDRRELALVAVERTRMPMVVSDPRQPDNPIVLANEAFLKLTGYAAEEVIGRNCRFLQGEGTDPAAIDEIRKGIETRDEFVEVELLNYRKDGSVFLNQLSISPVFDEEGTLLYHFASQKDVTEERRAEELEAAERMLLMEVDHRAMNALALVQSFVSLTRAETVKGFAASIRGRVQTLARAHRMLGESGWSGIDLARLLASETPDDLTSRVTASGPAVLVPAALVQSLALVFHELLANALRHGALRTAGGSVEVAWRRRDRILSIAWQEAGATGVAKPVELGVGLRMLENVVTRQLGGTVVLAWPGSGMRAELTVPLADAA